MYITRINSSISPLHESEHADDLALTSSNPYESDFAPFGDSILTKIDNLYVKEIDGVKTLKGTVAIHFKGENGKAVSNEQRAKILAGFRDINKSIPGYAIDIKFVDADKAGPENGHDRPRGHATVVVVENAYRPCREGQFGENLAPLYGCVTDQGKFFNGRKIFLEERAPRAVATHEFGHFLGLTHNSRLDSLMTGNGVQSNNSGLSDNEIRKVVDGYR
jgi:Matrixin